MSSNQKTNIFIGILFCLIVFLCFGLFRVYHGGNIGLKFVTKNSFSFTDTFVNLDDDILGQPKILVKSKHPAVFRQLVEMKYLESDEDAKSRLENEMKRKQDEIMEQIINNQDKLMKRLKNEY